MPLSRSVCLPLDWRVPRQDSMRETIPFILVLVPLMVSMGFDSMVGLMVVHFAVASGASTPF